MNRRKIISLVLVSLLAIVWLSGCGGDATPTPTAAPPPTETSAPAPLLAATPTTPPTTASAAKTATTLADALGKSKAATAYRVEMTVNGSGGLAGTPPGAQDDLINLVTMKGEVNGNDAHLQLQGQLAGFLGLAPTDVLEMVTYQGGAYVKGPIPLIGANEPRWYQAPPGAAQIAQPPLTPGAFLDVFGKAGLDPADFKHVGAEAVDGFSCEVFAGDKDVVVRAFQKLGGIAGASQEDLNSIDTAEFKFWVCDDGYLHQVMMHIQGHDAAKPNEKGEFSVLMKLYDYDIPVSIAPPSDAIPLNLPARPSP